jgi:hypothetical protein
VIRALRRVTAAVVAVLAVASCGGPAQVTLEELAFDTPAHEGNEVVTVGTVVEFTEDDGAIERHIVIEDEAHNRVELLPLEEAEPFIGARVEVTGRFEFDPERGRAIEVTEIRELRADR